MNIMKFVKTNKLLSGVFIAYIFLFMTMPDKAVLSVKNSMYYIIEMLEIMPVIFVLTSIVEVWVPKEVILKGFGDKSGIKGNVLSFVLGSVSAGPIYAAFPVCKMLLKKGASIMNIVIILSAWAVIKVPMLANEAKFLGVKFMSIRWMLTVVSIFVMAYIVSVIVKKESIPIDKELKIEEINGIDIREQYCIGCGLCKKLLPDYFEIFNKKAKLKNTEIKNQEIGEFKRIIEKCPAKAISFK